MPAQAAISKDTTQKTHAVCPRARKTAIRLAWNEEILGAAPRRATNLDVRVKVGSKSDARGSMPHFHFLLSLFTSSAPVAEQTTGIRLLNGTTQVRLLPGAIPLNAQSVRPAC